MNKQQKDKKMKNKQAIATFCITGALEKYKRVDAIVEIHNKTNARFVSGVSSRTDYLISSKKARAFGTTVIDENEMIAFIKAGNFPVKRV
jgi:NAD-dependent DNA ligase